MTAGQMVITYDVPVGRGQGAQSHRAGGRHGRTRARQRRAGDAVAAGADIRLRRCAFHREQIGVPMEVVILRGRRADRRRRRRRHRGSADPQTGCRAGAGHRIVAAGDLRRTGRPLRRPGRSRSARRAASPSTSTSACPPTIRSATATSSTRCSSPGSTSPPARWPGPDGLAADIPAAVRGVRGGDPRCRRRRPADPRDRHRRPHRLQRAGFLAGLAHPDQDADPADPDRQRPLLRRRRRRGAHPLPDAGAGHDHGGPPRDPGGHRPQQGRGGAPPGRGAGQRDVAGDDPAAPPARHGAARRQPRPAGSSWPTTTARPTGPSPSGRASECC